MSSLEKMIPLLTGKIFKVRDQAVVLDFDAAALYEVGLDQLVKSVTRHHKRFPNDFMFRLTTAEWNEISIRVWDKPQAEKSKPPLAFTNSGLFMLSSILKSQKAAEVSVLIIESLFSKHLS